MKIHGLFLLFLFAFLSYANSNMEDYVPYEVSYSESPDSISFEDCETREFEKGQRCKESFNNKSLASLYEDLIKFEKKNPQFCVGIGAIEGIYNSNADPAQLFSEFNEHPKLRYTFIACETISGAACEVMKNLSAFHPDEKWMGGVLIGTYVAKSIFWAIDGFLSRYTKASALGMIRAMQDSMTEVSKISSAMTTAEDIDCSSILRISNFVIQFIKNNNFEINGLVEQRFDRMTQLVQKLQKRRSIKNMLVIGGKLFSFVTGIAAGLSVAIKGQGVPASYYLTLSAGGIDSVVDSLCATFKSKPIAQKYVSVCELIYNSKYFLELLDKALVDQNDSSNAFNTKRSFITHLDSSADDSP